MKSQRNLNNTAIISSNNILDNSPPGARYGSKLLDESSPNNIYQADYFNKRSGSNQPLDTSLSNAHSRINLRAEHISKAGSDIISNY